MGIRGLESELALRRQHPNMLEELTGVLESWLHERGLVKEVPLTALTGTRLGIDANHYLRKLLLARDPQRSDAFLAATGGMPLTLVAEIEKNLKSLEKDKADIIPVFVFSGISPHERDRPHLVDDPRNWRRAQAWEHYEQTRVTQAQVDFANSTPVAPADIMRVVHRLFKQRYVEFVVAPYLAWAQLVYLERHERSYVHSMYGSTELFMFDGVDRVILDINFAAGTVSYASKQAILHDMGITLDQFLDLALLAGFEGSPTFPAIDPREFNIRSVIELIKQRGTGVNSVLAFRDFPPVFQSNYIETFARSRSMIKYSLVLVAQEGRVLPLPLVVPPNPINTTQVITAADVPADLGDIFSSRFPDELYYQLFRGLVTPNVINALASGYVIEPMPLCGGTAEYERFIKGMTEGPQSPRCVSLALLSNVLHPMWSKKPVSAIYYFDPRGEYPVPHSSPATHKHIESVTKWNVDARHVEDELRRQLSSTIDLCLCLGGTSTAGLAQRTIVAKNPEKPLEKKDEIVANTLWRFLELRGFLTNTHQHTPHAQALHAAMKASKVNDKFQESLFLAVELLRAGALHSGRIGNRSYSGGPHFTGSEADKRSMLLVMRVLSIVPLAFNAQPWTGPLSRELLVFNSFLRATTRSMRVLLEATLLNLLLRSDARRAREDYVDIALSLPFLNEANTGMGILFKAYGDAVCHMAGGVDVVLRAGTGTHGASEEDLARVKEAKTEVINELLVGAFPNVKNVPAELQRGFRFWRTAMMAVKSLSELKAIPPDLTQQFEAADAWLKPFEPPSPY
ncbi:hypothetical protein OIO90_005074 [Microbotryomycetes sp. JL221]|nr:hypothetical protein OIO90_005074 [Microbotryomycetes sp. JL221]